MVCVLGALIQPLVDLLILRSMMKRCISTTQTLKIDIVGQLAVQNILICQPVLAVSIMELQIIATALA